ncbi:hypothetical protein PEL8287_01071 [Roseovarius litorisediminis]|uniref:Thioesterase domain-containing protein n=1 Tax=Roseovarius litorisediminis TaxID=1312363 RepID=A0A1Y5RRY9_9RHOB|nr:PaaI family thioesterase [Roseovarius litorisediminis]SLN23739.1 hypothetical protein PEL8287_01071 [Roseovarius litorisediminis]
MREDLDPCLIEEPSALARHLGITLTSWKPDYARIEAPLSDFLLNRQGLPHGGVHATLLDTAMGFAGCYTGDPDLQQMALTLSMTVNYLAQAQGAVLVAEGWRTGGGRKTYFAEGRVTDAQGTIIATATGVFRYRNS